MLHYFEANQFLEESFQQLIAAIGVGKLDNVVYVSFYDVRADNRFVIN